jgi:hypothetical protein
VFIKDDHGCNGVGQCVFGAADAKAVAGAGGGAGFRPRISLTLKHRKELRPRNNSNGNSNSNRHGGYGSVSNSGSNPASSSNSNSNSNKADAKNAQTYFLQEGIPTCLKNDRTGAQLEIVLMLADGQVYSYFAREHHQHARSAGAGTANPQGTGDDCVSLNVSGAKFVQVINSVSNGDCFRS